MNRDIVWLVIVIILGGNTLVMLNSEEANDPNLIDIEELTCSLGEILVSNTSLVEGYECTEFDPHSITHAHPAPVLSVGNVIDDGFTIAVFGDVDHLHPDEITVRLSPDEDITISTQPNTEGAWSLTMQSSAERIYLNITATHDLEETTSDPTFIEINRTTPENNTNHIVNNTGNETGDGDTSQPQNSSILSAYHGLDQLPMAASLLCGINVAGDDGMPVVFSTQLQVDSVLPESFLVIRSDGERVVPNCATLNPAMEPLEKRTVLLTGDFGTFGETPLRVEVTGPLLTIDGESLLGVSTEDITPLEDGPRIVLAERFAPDTNGLSGECPDQTAQVVQLTWQGGVTGPDNAALGEDQRLGTMVLLDDGATVNPIALVDDDPDNHVLACLAEYSPAQLVSVHAGLFYDPGNIANPATQAEVTGDFLGPKQPTYDSSDMGQFWLDVFRCQDGQDITPVDDLTTTATEALECSVSITMNETHITITSNGLPDHDFESTLACSEANDCTRAQNYEWSIPRSPTNDTSGGHDATNCPEANGDYECAPALGDVAIAINGVPFYGPEDGPGGDAVASQHGMYEEDRQNIELGVCHAHSGMGGTYHYHADANCLHWHPEEGDTILDYDISTPAAVAQNTANGSHSAVVGVAMDGYPIYGFWGYDDDMNVVEMKSSYKLKEGETGYNGIDDYVYVEGLGHLDVCNGHFGPTPEFPDGIYHYHSTMMNGEGEMGFPYFLLCYHGETYLNEGGGGDNPDCSGHGVTWGPGIGPPPEGCGGGGPGAQSAEFQVISSNLTMSPYTMMMIVLFISTVIWHRIK